MNICCWIGPVTKFYGGYMQYIVKKEKEKQKPTWLNAYGDITIGLKEENVLSRSCKPW